MSAFESPRVFESQEIGYIEYEQLVVTDDSGNVDRKQFVQRLWHHGWAAVHINQPHFEPVSHWERAFGDVFALSKEELSSAGLYRGVQGVSVGYRQESERQFIECRLTSDNHAFPSYPAVDAFDQVVRDIFALLCPIGDVILRELATALDLDAQVFVDLTDLAFQGRLPPRREPSTSTTTINDNVDEDIPVVTKDTADIVDTRTVPSLSSSLLRICQYMNDQRDGIHSFGAHTDTSFLTLGLVSSTAALEMTDLISKTWESPEDHFPANTVLVFLGEFLQVLTRDRILPCVHRVRRLPRPSDLRISCPLLVRERQDMVIDFHNAKYQHPGGLSALTEDNIAPFDGIKMKMIHKILELKRKKCFEQHGSAEGDWVLSAFPVHE
jgi:isopenicillin N synthase-like dioxygenase